MWFVWIVFVIVYYRSCVVIVQFMSFVFEQQIVYGYIFLELIMIILFCICMSGLMLDNLEKVDIRI